MQVKRIRRMEKRRAGDVIIVVELQDCVVKIEEERKEKGKKYGFVG